MRKFIFFVVCFLCGASFLSACGEADEYTPIDDVRIDTIIINDTIYDTIVYRKDTIIINNNDTIFKTDTIVKIDTIVKHDTITQADTKKEASIEITLYMEQVSGNASIQGSAVYDNYLFEFSPSASCVYIYDLKNKTFVQSVKLSRNSQDHFNNASFGNFYSEDDKFPLLYISGGSSTYNPVDVYRIIQEGDVFSFENIQNISLPESSDDNRFYWTCVMIDRENEFIYAFSSFKGDVYLSKCNIPAYEIENVQLSEVDFLENRYIDSFTNKQGATIKDYYIYMATGIPGLEETTLRIYDLATKTRKYMFSLKDYGFIFEPEGISFYGEDLIISSQKGRGIYLVKFVNF